jgi:predicted metal-dependent peptidase
MTETPKKEFNLNDRLYILLRGEPFYAALSLHIAKEATMSVPTIAVGITDDGNFKLFYNKEFMSSLTPLQMEGALRHEFDHILYHHVFDRGPSELFGRKSTDEFTEAERKTAMKWNIAADLAVNSHIPEYKMSKNWVIPGIGKYKQFKKGKTAEQYYKEINQMSQEEQDELTGMGNQDYHYMWGKSAGADDSGDSTDSPVTLAEQRLKGAVKDAINEALRKGWGTVSKEMISKLKESLQTFINWKVVLKYFVRQTIKSNKKSSYLKINRRFPYMFPGKKSNRVAKIAIALDESGSVPNEFFVQFWAELNKLAENVSFTVIPFDHQVMEDKIFTWEKGMKIPCERVACGGTNFQAPVDWVKNEGSYDGLIIFTDLQAPEPTPSTIPRLWFTDKRNYDYCDWAKSCKDKIAVMF